MRRKSKWTFGSKFSAGHNVLSKAMGGNDGSVAASK